MMEISSSDIPLFIAYALCVFGPLWSAASLAAMFVLYGQDKKAWGGSALATWALSTVGAILGIMYVIGNINSAFGSGY